MKLREFLENKLFLSIFIFSLSYALYLIIFNQFNDVWWDSTSYIGMAKYFYSQGVNGVFEPMKPILLPLLLMVILKLGLSIVIFGKLLIFFSSLGTLIFIYLISKELFDEKTAFIASILTFSNPLFFILSFRIYSEMLTLCTFFGAIYFIFKFIKKENSFFIILSGAFCAFSIMSKYPNGLLAVMIDLFLLIRLFRKKDFGSFLLFNISLIFFMLPFFFLGFKMGGDYFYFYHISSQYFKDNLGHIYDLNAFPNIPRLIIPNNSLIYITSIIYLVNIILPFSLKGIWESTKLKNKNLIIYFLILPAFLFFLFYQIYYLKGERYIIIVFPILAILGAYSLSKIRRNYLWFIMSLYIFSTMFFSGSFLYNSYNSEKNYISFFVNPPVEVNCNLVSTNDPRSLLKYDKLVFPYEVYDYTWSPVHIIRNEPDCIFYFSCYELRLKHIQEIKKLEYQTKFYEDNGRCTYAIFYK